MSGGGQHVDLPAHNMSKRVILSKYRAKGKQPVPWLERRGETGGLGRSISSVGEQAIMTNLGALRYGLGNFPRSCVDKPPTSSNLTPNKIFERALPAAAMLCGANN